MGLTSYLQRSSVENPLRPLTDKALIEILGGVATDAGVSVNNRTAVKFIAVYRAVSLVSGVIAALPLQAKAGFEVVDVDLLKTPHPDMPPMEIWERHFWQLLLDGNTFSKKMRDRRGGIFGLDPYDLGTVTTRRVKKTARNPWGKEFDIQTVDWPKVLTPEDVLHIPGPSPDGVEGLSPVGVARQGIGVGLAAEQFGARHFGNGGVITGILQTEQKVDQGTADELKARWKTKVKEAGPGGDIAVIDSGAKYTPIGMKPADSQFIETRIHQVTEIARLYGIPPHLLAEVTKSTSWGTGIEQQNIGLIIFTLNTWMTRFEQRLAKECLPPRLTVDFDTGEIRRGDLKSQLEAAGTGVEKGILLANEARADLRLPPIDGGDRRTIPANWSVLGDDGLPIFVGKQSGDPLEPGQPAPEPSPEPEPDEDDDEETDE